jgi:hypothetical protein
LSEEDRIHHSVGGPQASLLRTQPRDYDMYDSQSDLQRWPKLAPVLQDCEVTLGEAYRRADSIARRYEYRYTVSAYMAAIFIPVLQLSLVMVEMPWWGRLGDFVAAIAAVGAIYALITRRLGIAVRRLVEREKAERCRFSKFSLLISPESWVYDSSPEARIKRQKELRARLEEKLGTLDWQSSRDSVARQDRALEDTTFGVAGSIDKETLEQLLDYYHEKRLNYVINQLNYFYALAKRRIFFDRLARICSPLFFYLGILAALAYFSYKLSMHYSERDALSSALLLSSACLPVVGFAVDQFRKANGFGRSVSEIRATSNELKQL